MKKLCECGCGKEVREGRRFIHGHHSRVNHPKGMLGKHHSLKTKEKMSDARKGKNHYRYGKHLSVSTKKKISKTLSGRTKETHDYIKRHSEKVKGRTKDNDEGIRRRAEMRKGRTKETHDYIRKTAEALKGRTKETHEGVRRMAETLAGRTKETHESVKRQSEALTGRTKETHEGVKRQADAIRGRTKENDEGTRIMAEKMAEHWQDHKYVEMMMKALARKPNKSEKLIESLLNKLLPNEYRINVKGEIMILGGKRPDFVNINGQKKVIEYNGDHWHTEEESKERAALFKSLGFDTLFIWGHEMKDIQAVIHKILDFNDAPMGASEKGTGK